MPYKVVLHISRTENLLTGQRFMPMHGKPAFMDVPLGKFTKLFSSVAVILESMFLFPKKLKRYQLLLHHHLVAESEEVETIYPEARQYFKS